MTGAQGSDAAVRRVRLRRAYEPPGFDDGRRILVDRLWPRGLTKDVVRADVWEKEAAPSSELRHWFGHDPAKWDEFRRRYRHELESQPRALNRLLDAARAGPITLVFGAADEHHNQAVVLKELLDELLRPAAEAEQRDAVGQASYDSFPASDPPSWAIGQLRPKRADPPHPEKLSGH